MKLLDKIKWTLCILLAFSPVAARSQVLDTSVRTRIYAAATSGDVLELKRLASLGYSLDMEDENGNTPYCQAVWSQNRVAVAALIQVGVNVHPNCLKRIPYVTETRIYAAAHAEDLDQLVAWKKEGLNVDVVNPKTGNSALCEAVYNYDCPAIQTLLRAGSQQAQPCMRRVPQEVREKLQCRPLRIDWKTIGYAVLGAGMAGALVAILGSDGSNGTPTCPATQRWNGHKCLSCDTCWIGNTCISSQEMKNKPYYPDETTAECWVVAPPPVTMTDDQLDEAVQKIEDENKYKKGNYLPMINASAAYARGYSGYMVERTSPYGRLVNGAVEYGKEPILSDKKVTVAVYSSGMAIGQGGTISNITTGNSGSSSAVQENSVWDWTSVNRAFYDSLAKDADGNALVGEATYTPTKGTTTIVNGEWETLTGASVKGTRVAEVGAVKNNFALTNYDGTGTPYGYNFDYGECPEGVKKNCYSYKILSIKMSDTTTKKYGFAVVYEGTQMKYIITNTKTAQVIGFTTTAPTKDTIKQYARWAGSGEEWTDVEPASATINGNILSTYQYVTDYVYDETNPRPHYTDSSGLSGSRGTFLAGIIGAMNLDDPNTSTYGVAYNTALLPVNQDVVRGLSYSAMEKMVNNADVILLDEVLSVNRDIDISATTALGGFTEKDGTYTAQEIEDVLGTDALSMYKLLSKDDKERVAIMPNGDGQLSAAWEVKHPGLQAAVPLLKGLNSSSSWTPGSVLPTVDDTNPLYHLYLTVGAIDSVTKEDGKTRATLSPVSQPCGIAGSYCLVAPGGESNSSGNGIYSTMDPTLAGRTDGYAYQTYSGTREAAATVAGAVAVLMGAYPHLTARQVVEILFKTATYITPTDAEKTIYGSGYSVGSDSWGEYNSIYGRGLINLAAATEPVGGKDGLWVYKSSKGTAIGEGTVVKASATKLIAPVSLASSQSLSASLPANFIAFDSYNRPFEVATNGLFQLRNRRKMKSWNDFKMFMNGRDPVTIQPTDNFSMMYRNPTNRVQSSAHIPMGLLQVNLKKDKMRYGLFYSQDTTMGRDAYWKRRLSNPFVQMRDAYGLETGYDFNSKWSVEVGWTTGRNGFFDDDDRSFDAPDNKMQAFTSSVVYKPIDKVAFKVSTGIMKETGSSLGMVSEGAFNIKGANTHFVGAGVVFSPMDKVRLEAMYYYGQTKTNSDGGLMNLSKLTSDSFAFTASYQPTEDHLFGLQVSSPLRVRKGSLNVSLPVGRHPTEDAYYYDTYQTNMKPKARELDLSMYYQGHVSDEVSLQSEMGVRLNPDHQADAAPDYRGMIGVKWEY